MRFANTFFLLFLACACVRQAAIPETDTLPKAVKSIAVLPTGVMTEVGAPPPSPKELKEKEDGAAVLDQILAEVFADNPKVHILSDEEVNLHSQAYGTSPMAQALEIGRAVGVEAVMVWGLERYSERLGGDYGVQTPSSVAFQYRLIHVQTGQTLCGASFLETQKSASDNLLALGTSARRGFKWVSASVLLREGVHKKLSDCDYLTKSADGEGGEVSTTAKKIVSEPILPMKSVTMKESHPASPALFEAAPKMITTAHPQAEAPPVHGPALDMQSSEITKFVDEWRKAWEATAGPRGDIDHYGAFYAADFKSDRLGRNLWLADKRKKNSAKKWIKLTISDIAITDRDNGTTREVSFLQEYSSSNYSDTSRKSLTLRKNGNNWEIMAEH